jgi:RHS Repeat
VTRARREHGHLVGAWAHGPIAGSGNGVANFSYTYDAFGNVLSRADGNTNVVEGFGYDSLNRLTESSVSRWGEAKPCSE